MAEAFIVRRGGGGGSGGTLVVTSSGAGTVTVSNSALNKSYSKSVTAGGSVTFKGLKTGEWTVTLSNGTQTTTKSVTVNADYSVSIAYFSATISVTYPASSTCTCTDGTTTLNDTNDTSSAKTVTFTVPNTGTWTITATDGDKTKSTTVSIATDGQSESVTLEYTWWLYHRGNLCEDVTGGWVKTGIGGSLTFNNNSMTLVANAYQKTTLASTANKVNLSGKRTLHFTLKSATSYESQGYPRIGVSPTQNPVANETTYWAATQTLWASSSFYTVSVDVSSLTSSYYILFAGLNGDSGPATIEVQDIWGE